MAVKWACGVTTVPERRADLLPRTLASLRNAGFDLVHLFVDGAQNPGHWEGMSPGGLITCRSPKLRAYGSWCLALAELYIRNPRADRFAIFQDDVAASKNLRAYLDACPLSPWRYWNLITYPRNIALAGGKVGWHESCQRGWGAQGLVFSLEGVLALLTSRYIAERPLDQHRGHKSIDGGVSTGLRKVAPGPKGERWVELCHNPSLLGHCGVATTIDAGMAKPNQPEMRFPTFRGEGFDCLELLKK